MLPSLPTRCHCLAVLRATNQPLLRLATRLLPIIAAVFLAGNILIVTILQLLSFNQWMQSSFVFVVLLYQISGNVLYPTDTAETFLQVTSRRANLEDTTVFFCHVVFRG